MKVIYKYQLPKEISEIFKIELPKHAEILSVQSQNNEFVMWAKVDPLQEKEEIQLIWIMTGTEIPDATSACLDHIETIQLMDENFVIHLFQIKSPYHKIFGGFPFGGI